MLELLQHMVQAKVPLARLYDYLGLTKPRVLSLLLLTTVAAMVITSDTMPAPALIVWTLLGGYLTAGGAGAINCAIDHDIDRQMTRTSRRAIPAGRISATTAYWFGGVLILAGFLVLAFGTTLLAAILALVGVVYYTLVYTRWLKRSTMHNVVIGGGAGALPPLVGAAAATSTIPLSALLLAIIIFLWTPVHFYTLALLKKEEYARACLPMLPVVVGERETRRHILRYALATAIVTILAILLQSLGIWYTVLAIVLNTVLLGFAWRVWRGTTRTTVWHFYGYSLIYLALLFWAMVMDAVLPFSNMI